jgi:hypothetical protein
MMLSESSLGPDGDVLRACAQTALDFINIRERKSARPSEGGMTSSPLPAPYEELRRKLADEFAAPKRGRRKREVSNPTVEKLSKQFKTLQSAKNIGPYNSFARTAEALLTETEGTDSEPTFKAIRDIALMMREIARGEPDARNPLYVTQHSSFEEYPLRTSHPAVLTLWEYMCKLGGRKFGSGWESAARTARMSMIISHEEFKPAYDKVMAVKHFDDVSGKLPITAERYYSGWTEQERFILLFLAVSDQSRDKYDLFEDFPEKTVMRWFKTLGEIGKKRRSGMAWPKTVRQAFEKLILSGGGMYYADSIAREDLPFECMTMPTIAVIVLCFPSILKLLKHKLKSHLPLEVSDNDKRILERFCPKLVFPVPALRAACELFDRKGRGIFLDSILISTIGADLYQALNSSDQRMPTLWGSMSQPHIALFAENLPEGSQIAAFCQLCLGQKPMSLSDDPSGISAFFSSRPDENQVASATLSLFLMTWPGVSVEFLLRFFESTIEGHKLIQQWDVIPKIISKIQSQVDRKEVARGVSLILKRKCKDVMNPSLKYIIKTLGTLAKGDRLPENYDKERDNLDDDFDLGEDSIFKMFKRMFKKWGKK